MELQRQELIDYLAIVEERFDPNDPLTLQALLFLFYSNYTIWRNENEIFTEKLLALVERCHLNEANNEQHSEETCPMCPPPSGRMEVMPPEDCCPRGRWAHDPYDIPRDFRSELVSAGARALFFNGAPAQRTRME